MVFLFEVIKLIVVGAFGGAIGFTFRNRFLLNQKKDIFLWNAYFLFKDIEEYIAKKTPGESLGCVDQDLKQGKIFCKDAIHCLKKLRETGFELINSYTNLKDLNSVLSDTERKIQIHLLSFDELDTLKPKYNEIHQNITNIFIPLDTIEMNLIPKIRKILHYAGNRKLKKMLKLTNKK